MQSPQANTPFIFVCIFSFTTIKLFLIIIPNFLAISTVPATPSAINTPSVFNVELSLNLTSFTLFSPTISSIFFVITSTLLALISGDGPPFVRIVILFAIFIKSLVSEIA